MKALSIVQPWAHLIELGYKTIETRTWPTRYRGPLLIVSSKRKVTAEEYRVWRGGFPRLPPHGGIMYGQALAVARLVGCRRMQAGDEIEALVDPYEGGWSWVLEDVRATPKPFPVTGRLGLYDVEYREEC